MTNLKVEGKAPMAGNSQTRSGSGIERLKDLGAKQETLLIGVFIVMVLVFTIINPRFFSAAAFSNILQDFGPVMLMATAQTFIMLTGGIDLSVGALLGLSGVSAALAVRWANENGASPTASILAGVGTAILVGALVGGINAFLITRVKLAPFIATLAMMGVCTGTTLVVTGGVQIAGAPRELIALGNSRFLGVLTIPLVVVIVVLFIAWLILSRTQFGRHSYAIGSNRFAARVAGINVNKHLVKVYIIGGILASLAGLFVYFRLGSGSPSSGRGGELQAIAAAVIGGVSLFGGVGRITGTILGALITASVLSGLILIGVEPNAQQIVVGILIAFAVAVQGIGRNRSTV
ncbi:ABC transporter permease [Paramicrobacterium agarici]|uniref:ABC transporter permease n=1 Tax=Paramicrobacterium agarici TaxID=630514 RepID=UPI001151C4BD|nr:ABC transporter permease [Microbacterium agarici]TQO22975.1 monosaccharide ABC transporter membrane protein (CUT2 family) [Microbacterium agarici]